ncbi:arginine N-methyltransferase [Perkinsela sp. CCAP 1560/4]|nr:arginine N-methyltransferase [Perkinsela sp. CCAP 1560/4]|eukprot:KNH05275.1 arginine N-methyltransferase [Perkinsela sp. CCAP 1560/4]
MHKSTTVRDDKPVAPESVKKCDYYFDSYSHYGIHESMLKDSHRTESYRDAMFRNSHVFKDKTVLDVGCGTGILSMFAAKAGAKKVYAIDCSDIAKQAKKIVQANQLDDIITVIQAKLEDLQLETKVDIIVSEWMGYFLFYESMLNSVLYARDRFGTSDVIILPNKATLYVSGIQDAESWSRRTSYWDNVHGIKMSSMSRKALIEPAVEVVKPAQLITNSHALMTIDINKTNVEALTFDMPFTLRAKKQQVMHGICGHFDTLFDLHDSVLLTTSPYGTQTHWKQTVFYLAEPISLQAGNVVSGRLSCRPNARNHRDLDIHICMDVENGAETVRLEQDYRLR